MKKFVALLVTVVLAVCACFVLAGCNNDEAKVKLIDIDLSNEEYAFGVKKSDTALLNSVNTFLSEKDDEIQAIFNKYFDADAEQLASFGDSSIKTESTDPDNELVVATNLEFAPFEYTNGSKIAGIDMEIAQLLANYLNKTLVVVNMDFDAVVTAVQTQDVYDIAMAGLTIDEGRKEQVAFSDAYFGATQAIIVKADDTTFDDCTTAADVEAKLATLTGDSAKCGGQKATTSQFYVDGDEDLGFDGFDNLEFSAYPSAALAVQDMLNGNISFVIVDKTTANAIVKSYND